VNTHKTATKRTPTSRSGTIPIAHIEGRKKPWQLTLTINGRRQRPGFETEKKALTAWRNHCRVLNAYGSGAAESLMQPDVLADLDQARRLLQPTGATLTDAATYYLDNYSNSKVTIDDARQLFIGIKRSLNREWRTVDSLNSVIGLLARNIGPSRMMSSILRAEVLKFILSPKAARTAHNRCTTLGNFFRYAKRVGWIGKNPIADLRKDDLPKPQRKPKQIPTPTQIAEILRFVMSDRPQCIPNIAVRAFAGIRTAEADRMTWDMIKTNEKQIRIPAEICKTDDDWILSTDMGLPPNLWGWLDLTTEQTGPFVAPSKRYWRRIIKHTSSLEGDLHLPLWPFNGFRRAFCTYLMSIDGNANRVAALMRHQSPTRLYNSYLSALVPTTVAQQFLKITPPTP